MRGPNVTYIPPGHVGVPGTCVGLTGTCRWPDWHPVLPLKLQIGTHHHSKNLEERVYFPEFRMSAILKKRVHILLKCSHFGEKGCLSYSHLAKVCVLYKKGPLYILKSECFV